MSDSPPSSRVRKTPREAMFAVLPTLFTLGNAVCGFGAITFAALAGPEQYAEVVNTRMTANQMLFASAGLIFLAMVFDVLDGSVARLTKQTSEFGAQLDSLCDAISFGVAPAFLMLTMMHPKHKLVETIAPLPFEYPPRLLWAIAVMFMVCAVLRLARFNSETDEQSSHESFDGLPTPAAAGVVASFPIGLQGLKELAGGTRQIGNLEMSQQFAERFLSPVTLLLPIATMLVAGLMVSRFKYPHIVFRMVSGRGDRIKILKIIFSLFLIFLIREMAVPFFFCYFAFAEPLRWCVASAWRWIWKPRASSAH